LTRFAALADIASFLVRRDAVEFWMQQFIGWARAPWSLGVVAAAMALSFATGARAQGADSTRVIVAFKAGAHAQGRAAVAAARGVLKQDLPALGAAAFELPSAAIAGLQRNPNIDYVEEDAKRYPLAVGSGGEVAPYGVHMVQADQLSMAAPRKVCIIDSGFDLGHPDLPSSGVTGEYDSGTGWWYTDENHHGTHVAGTIAALTGNGTGVASVAPGVQLHIVKVFSATGWAYSSTLSAAALKCQSAGAHVINMSLGGSISNRTESRTFDSLLAAGILPIAAAGNDGNNRTSYPAGYASVMSVAAVDEAGVRASFSQYNKTVEISAPGVGVLSTVPRGTGLQATLSVGATGYAPNPMDGSPNGSVSASLANFGDGSTASAGSMTGKVCLIARGTVSFSDKVLNCQASGGVGAVIYNNVAGALYGTLGGVATAIPSVGVSDTEGAALLGQLGQSAALAIGPSDYAYFDGTSMATPHVAAVAALVWSNNTGCTASKLRASLTKSAQDLGASGRDNYYGWGLVQAKAADTRIKNFGCGN
jgi:subtilisin family serine protease